MSPDFEVSANLRFWPVLEIATFELLAENRPFGIAQRHQFKCNGHSPLVAESRLTTLRKSARPTGMNLYEITPYKHRGTWPHLFCYTTA